MINKKQRGIVLLVLAIVIALTASAYYFSNISLFSIKLDKSKQTRIALVKAKQSLIDYAVINWQVTGLLSDLGHLPCPDYKVTGSPPEGEQDSSCGTAYANGIGYFPWGTLNIDVLFEESGSCLFYAVSPAYKSTPAAALNPDSFGQFQIVDSVGGVVQGSNPEERPVAIIFAPGKALGGQSRNHDANSFCGLDYANIIAYLDDDGITDNAAIDPGVDNIIDQFVTRYDGSEEGVNPLNDRLITITHNELWQALDSSITSATFDTAMRNLTEAIAMCFAAYGSSNINNNLPMPAPLDLAGGEYRRNVDYDDNGNFTAAFAGRLPYDVSRANTELVNGNQSYIFDNTFCDNLNLLSTANMEDIHFTDDSGSDNGEYFDLWKNWKDHFFYAISKAYNPSVTVPVCPGDCIRVNGIDRAGIVFFSGRKQTVAGVAQQRYAPPFDGALALDGVDDKDDVVNYLENGNDVRFPNNAGNETYARVTLPSNDIMFCIETDMSVSSC